MAKALKYLPEADTLKAIDRTKVRHVLRKAFEGLSNGSTVQPQQTLTVFPNDEGDCIFYPGLIWDLNLIGVKLSPFINALKRDGKYPVTAYTLLLSASSGTPLLLCDSYALTTNRTAATTALALEYLTAPNARILAVMGAGKAAVEHLKYVSEQHEWTEIRVWSPSLAQDPIKARNLRTSLSSFGCNVTLPETARQTVDGADVIMLCTSSGTPVLELDWLKADCTITSISTNVPRAHEIAPEALRHLSVFCDYRITAPTTAGEMVIALEKGLWTSDSIVGDLSDLIIGKVKRPERGRIFFRSTGLGIEDLAIASLLV